MNPHNQNNFQNPIPSWSLAFGIITVSVAGIVGVYYLLILTGSLVAG